MSADLKMARSLVRLAEIQATLQVRLITTSDRIYAFVESELIESIFRSSEFSFSGSKLLTLTGIRDLVLHLDLPCETPYEKVIQGFYLQQPFFS